MYMTVDQKIFSAKFEGCHLRNRITSINILGGKITTQAYAIKQTEL